MRNSIRLVLRRVALNGGALAEMWTTRRGCSRLAAMNTTTIIIIILVILLLGGGGYGFSRRGR